jgi:hypothetical protein
MREFILATFLIFNGCTAPANKNDRDSSGVSTVDTTHPNKSTSLNNHYDECNFHDIFLLARDKKLFQLFFDELEKWNRSHSIGRDDTIFVEISKPLLSNFISTIDEKKIGADGEIIKNYEFDLSPKEYQRQKKCKDQIRLSLDKTDCTFFLTVRNVFYVDDFGSSEHDKIYGFKIVDGKVKIISVDEAG